jgi:aryl sulfotransferase
LDETECNEVRSARCAFWDAGAQTFIHKGVNGRWTETLTTQESQAYEEMVEKKLGIECARWFASGAQ